MVTLGDEEYELMDALLNTEDHGERFERVFRVLLSEKQQSFLEACIAENLLRAKKVEELKLILDSSNLEDQIMNYTKQLVLEVTEKCNFRCKYCIYNEDYEGDRNFGQQVMDWEIAKRSIDYVIEHSAETVSITFYGGEPLLNYRVMEHGMNAHLAKPIDIKEVTRILDRFL